jgi:hypothetical protein
MASRLSSFHFDKLEEGKWCLGRLRLVELIWSCLLMLMEEINPPHRVGVVLPSVVAVHWQQ